LFIATTAPGVTYSLNAAGSGFTDFVVENNSNLDGIQGTLFLHGHPAPGANDILQLTDFLNLAAHTFTLSTGEVQRDGISPIFYDGLDELNVLTGQGVDNVNVHSNGNLFTTVATFNSLDMVTMGEPTAVGGHTLQNILTGFRVESPSNQAPTILIDDSGDPSTLGRTVSFANDPIFGYTISNLAPGPLYLHLGTGSPVTVVGDGADETFDIQDLPLNLQLTLNGGRGTNTLDYSRYVGNVTVDLPLGVATGFAGIANIQNVTGSQGNDLIVGDANPNVLIGGTRRNVLIGGGGGDTLDASGASSDNILIAGTTDFDTNPAALDAIFAEWTRTRGTVRPGAASAALFRHRRGDCPRQRHGVRPGRLGLVVGPRPGVRGGGQDQCRHGLGEQASRSRTGHPLCRREAVRHRDRAESGGARGVHPGDDHQHVEMRAPVWRLQL
jgi:hypothetical protein